MELVFTYSIIFGFIFVNLIILFRYYWILKKKFSGFPVYHLLPRLLYRQVTKKLPRNVSLNSIIFQELINVGKQHTEEGLFMAYSSRPVLFIFSEEAVKFFLNHNAATDKSPDYKFVQDFMGRGINTSDGERHRIHRNMISPSFHMGMLKEKVPLFNHHALSLVKDLETMADKVSTDLLDALKIHYFNALSESIIGLKQNEKHRTENLKSFHLVDNASSMIVERIGYPWLHWKIFMIITSFGRKFSRITKNYKTFIENVISDMKTLVFYNNTENTERFSNHLRKSFTYILLNHHLNEPMFTFDDVYDEVSTLIVTGYDTVTYSTLWCLYMLGLHPEIQEKAFDEIQSKTGSYITYEESCNLTYLESVILETLRLLPTVPIFARNLSDDVQYGKYKVSKNTTIAFFPFLLHRNPAIYPNPENFEPERFLNGKKYAIIEMKIFLAHILRNFKITSFDRREDVGLCWNIVIMPAKQLRMKITPREAACT